MNPALKGAVIFDRDGVLNQDVGYAFRPDQIVWTDGALEAVTAVNQASFLALVATNQSGVARGYYQEADVVALHHWMNDQLRKIGAHIDGFAYCPHHIDAAISDYKKICFCRKPGPGMILRLIEQFGLDPSRTVMIGDNLTDMEAADAAGVTGVLFRGGSLLDLVRPLVGRLTAMTTT